MHELCHLFVILCARVLKAGTPALLQKTPFLLNHLTTIEVKLNYLNLAAASCPWVKGCENACCLKARSARAV